MKKHLVNTWPTLGQVLPTPATARLFLCQRKCSHFVKLEDIVFVSAALPCWTTLRNSRNLACRTHLDSIRSDLPAVFTAEVPTSNCIVRSIAPEHSETALPSNKISCFGRERWNKPPEPDSATTVFSVCLLVIIRARWLNL